MTTIIPAMDGFNVLFATPDTNFDPERVHRVAIIAWQFVDGKNAQPRFYNDVMMNLHEFPHAVEQPSGEIVDGKSIFNDVREWCIACAKQYEINKAMAEKHAHGPRVDN